MQTPRIITAITAQRRATDRVNLHVDGEFVCGVAYEVVIAERLRAGSAIEEGTLERIRRADAAWLAKQHALSLLSVRARSTGELGDRLRRKGYDDAAASHALAEVARLGLLDDMAFAESWVRDRIRLKPRGARALIAELGRKRIPADMARAAVARVMQDEDVADNTLCHAAAERWARRYNNNDAGDGVTAMKRKRRLSSFLARRGYGSAEVRAAVDIVLGRVHSSGA